MFRRHVSVGSFPFQALLSSVDGVLSKSYSAVKMGLVLRTVESSILSWGKSRQCRYPSWLTLCEP